jgi:hypothetical protein
MQWPDAINRAELQQEGPETFALLRKIWSLRKATR